MIDQLRIKTPGPDRITRWLSGGNQQKVVLAKWLAGHAEIFIFDEPTRGIDVAARRDIYDLMNTLRGAGRRRHHGLFGSPGSPRHERPDPRDATRSDSSRIRREVGLRSRDHARGVWSGLVSAVRPGASRARQFGTLARASRARPRPLDPDAPFSHRLEPAERARAELDQRHRCGRHDVRDHLRRHRPLCGVGPRAFGNRAREPPSGGRRTAGRADARAGERRRLRPAERPVRDDGASAAVHRDARDDERRPGPGADLGRRPADLRVRRDPSV